MEPVDGGDGDWRSAGKEGRATNVGGDGVTHDSVAPGVLDASNALDRQGNAPGESHGSVCMATRDLDSAEVIIGDLSRDRLVVRRVGDAGCDAIVDNFR